MPKKILIPLPSYGFDPTEVAIPWKVLNEAGFDIVFATPDGHEARADRLMLCGERLGDANRLSLVFANMVGG